MSRINSTTVEGVLTSLVPAEWLREEARATGAEQRRRKVDIVSLFWTLVLGYGVGKYRSLAELRRTYEQRTRTTVEESSFYDRFSPGLAKLLRRAAERVLTGVAPASRQLSEGLRGFRDLVVLDATVVRLHDLLKGAFAACRTNHTRAAAKVHVVMSVLRASPSRVRLTPERTNERSPWRRVGPWVRGCLLMMDLGYFGFRLFSLIDENGGYFLSRMRGNANPIIVAQNRKWRGRSRSLVGKRLKDVLVGLRRQVIDVMVEVVFPRRVYGGRRHRDVRVFRLVGVFNEGTRRHHLYLTNIPVEKLSARDVAATYRLRWQVELLFKELKTHYRLDQMPSARRVVVETLVYAAILTLAASRALLDALRRRLPAGRSVPPLRWAAVFDGFAPALLGSVIAAASGRRPPTDPWLLLASQAVDPNVGRPHALIQMGLQPCGLAR